MNKNDILLLIKEIATGLNKKKKISLEVTEKLLNIKFDGSDKHVEYLKKFLSTLSFVEKKPEENKDNKIVQKKSNNGYFYLQMFAGIGFTGFAGFLMYYLLRKKYN